MCLMHNRYKVRATNYFIRETIWVKSCKHKKGVIATNKRILWSEKIDLVIKFPLLLTIFFSNSPSFFNFILFMKKYFHDPSNSMHYKK